MRLLHLAHRLAQHRARQMQDELLLQQAVERGGGGLVIRSRLHGLPSRPRPGPAPSCVVLSATEACSARVCAEAAASSAAWRRERHLVRRDGVGLGPRGAAGRGRRHVRAASRGPHPGAAPGRHAPAMPRSAPRQPRRSVAPQAAITASSLAWTSRSIVAGLPLGFAPPSCIVSLRLVPCRLVPRCGGRPVDQAARAVSAAVAPAGCPSSTRERRRRFRRSGRDRPPCRRSARASDTAVAVMLRRARRSRSRTAVTAAGDSSVGRPRRASNSSQDSCQRSNAATRLVERLLARPARPRRALQHGLPLRHGLLGLLRADYALVRGGEQRPSEAPADAQAGREPVRPGQVTPGECGLRPRWRSPIGPSRRPAYGERRKPAAARPIVVAGPSPSGATASAHAVPPRPGAPTPPRLARSRLAQRLGQRPRSSRPRRSASCTRSSSARPPIGQSSASRPGARRRATSARSRRRPRPPPPTAARRMPAPAPAACRGRAPPAPPHARRVRQRRSGRSAGQRVARRLRPAPPVGPCSRAAFTRAPRPPPGRRPAARTPPPAAAPPPAAPPPCPSSPAPAPAAACTSAACGDGGGLRLLGACVTGFRSARISASRASKPSGSGSATVGSASAFAKRGRRLRQRRSAPAPSRCAASPPR